MLDLATAVPGDVPELMSSDELRNADELHPSSHHLDMIIRQIRAATRPYLAAIKHGGDIRDRGSTARNQLARSEFTCGLDEVRQRGWSVALHYPILGKCGLALDRAAACSKQQAQERKKRSQSVALPLDG